LKELGMERFVGPTCGFIASPKVGQRASVGTLADQVPPHTGFKTR
jgi:hypothetical protein